MMEQMGLAPWEREGIEWNQPIRVVSWNVNGIRAVAKKGLFQFLEAYQPSIFCVQETKALKEQCEPELHDNEKYVCFWHSAKRPGYSGVATYSKQRPLEVVSGVGIEKFDQEGRLLKTRHEHFSVLNMYYPNGGSGPERQAYKMEFLDAALKHFKELSAQGEKLVIVGDYNIARSEKDIFDPKGLSGESGFLPEEREWMDQLEKAGFVDTFRALHPHDEGAYTWWSYFQGARFANHGWRIDYIYISEALRPFLKSALIHPDVTGSDHCPVSADFEF